MENLQHVRSFEGQSWIAGMVRTYHMFRTDPGTFRLSWRGVEEYIVPVPRLLWCFEQITYSGRLRRHRGSSKDTFELDFVCGFEGDILDENTRYFFPAFPNQSEWCDVCSEVRGEVTSSKDIEVLTEAARKYLTEWMHEPFSRDYSEWRSEDYSPWGGGKAKEVLERWSTTPVGAVLVPGFYPWTVDIDTILAGEFGL